MDHFFEKLHTSEEQLSHFIEQISHLQQVILDCPNFENLLAELDHQHPND